MDPSLAVGGTGGERDEVPLQRELPALRRFLRRLLGRRGADEADDLAQEVMARALRYRHAFDGERAAGPWLRRTALRAFFDRRAAAQRDPLDGAEREVELGAEASDVLERREYVAHLLAQLTPLERDILLRFHARGESIREVAEALGMPEGTVKSHLHRARRRLAHIATEREGENA